MNEEGGTDTTRAQFSVPYLTKPANYLNTVFTSNKIELGIPTMLVIDALLDITAAAAILSNDNDMHNFYYENVTDGDLVNIASAANNVRDANKEMTYWSVIAARRIWWTADLVGKQTNYHALTQAAGTLSITDIAAA